MKLDIKKKLKEEIEKQVEIHVSDYFFTQDISLIEMKETLENTEETVKNSELSYHTLCDMVTREELDEAVTELVENSTIITKINNQQIFKRIKDLETLSFSQSQNDENSEKIKRLEEENQEIKERLLHLENFILKIFKGF
jgi:hypothetical protein